jgi:hypothetical protein
MTRSRDTSLGAQARYLDALRRLTPEDRFAAAAAMSAEIRTLAEAGVRSRHPEYSPDEVRAAVADILLGPDLAGVHRVRRGHDRGQARVGSDDGTLAPAA